VGLVVKHHAVLDCGAFNAAFVSLFCPLKKESGVESAALQKATILGRRLTAV